MEERRDPRSTFALWALILLCVCMAAATGGGLYEQFVLVRLSNGPNVNAASLLASPGAVPLRNFWMPVHGATAFFGVTALMLTWSDPAVRTRIVVGLLAYATLRIWSGLYFIPEMLAMQSIMSDGGGTLRLNERLSDWQFWFAFREPLAVLALCCFLLALASLRRR